MQEFNMPQKGDIWYSPRTGYKVRIVAVEPNARVIVTDGTNNYSMYLSHFRDPGNAWSCVRRSTTPTPLGLEPRPRPPVHLRPKYKKRRKTKDERANGS